MHKKVNPNRRRNIFILIAGGVFSVIVVASITIFIAVGNNGNNGGINFQTVTQPASAAQVAKNLNCTGFKDLGGGMPSGLGVRLYVIDSGSCYIGSDKYAIDTFPTKAVRDNWLQAATQLGVVPKWETDTSVTYPSVD